MNIIANTILKSYRISHLNKKLTYFRSICRSINVLSNEKSERKIQINNGPDLKHFIKDSINYEEHDLTEESVPYINNTLLYTKERKVFFYVYGCQMNVNDTEIVWSILKNNNFVKTEYVHNADVVLVMTCAIREGAENKIWRQLVHLKSFKKKIPHLKIGILGCMAERLKHQLIEKEKAVDLVAGPDSYKDLPRLLAMTENDQTAVNVLLSLEETYADIMPVRLNQNSKSAFVSIMRGCDNMCTYCIVPFTRGRERSRPIDSIVNEVKHLSEQGVKEVTLLGQNVNSYRDLSEENKLSEFTKTAKGFKTVYKTKKGGLRFAELLDRVSLVDNEMRIRFTSPHPKDFPDEVLHIINERPNICKSLHLPAQSGNSAVLERMRRGYTRESYLELVDHIRSIIPGVSLSSDFICGFCGETDEEFNDTLTMLELVKYNTAFLFPYSMREKTTAHRRYKDDVPDEVKRERHLKMYKLYQNIATELNKASIGEVQLVLIEGESKRSSEMLAGRNEKNIKVIVPSVNVPVNCNNVNETKTISAGDYVAVKIEDASFVALKGTPLFHSTINTFDYNLSNYALEKMKINI